MLKNNLTEYTNKLKVNKYSVIITNPLNQVTIVSNQPTTWEQDFIKMRLHINSHIVQKAKGKITPFIWSKSDTDSCEMKSLAMKYGIYGGITFIINIKCDIVIFTLYYDKDDSSLLEKYRTEKHQMLFDILHLFENQYTKNIEYHLTNREKDVIKLLTIGKTYSETSIILNVSERTVRFHVHNILEKMNVSSVKYAVVKAMIDNIV